MELQQLRYVAALARYLNFRKAAESVHVTQPTLSQQLQKLEDELGTQLFERSPRRVRLTPAGERFVPYAMSILETAREAMQVVAQENEEAVGMIKIGVIPTLAPYLLPGLARRLQKRAPLLRLELIEETTSNLMEKLKSGTIELALLSLPIREEGFISEAICDEPFLLAVHAEHRLAKQTAVTPSDLKGERILLLKEGHCFRDQALSYCQAGRIETEMQFESDHLFTVMSLAASGYGITFIPAMAINRRISANLAYIPFAAPVPKREIGAIMRRNTPKRAAQTEILRAARAEAKQRLAISGDG